MIGSVSTGRTTSQAKPKAGHRYAAMILGGLCLVTVYSYLRGQRNEPEWAGLVYYVIDYSDGLIRRALVGQGFMAFFTRAQSAQVWAAALTVHRAVCMLTMGGLVLWLWSVFWRRQRFAPARLALVYLLFAASQFLPTLAAINTYLDAYVFLLVLAAFWLAAQRREWAAACLGVVAPLIHEMSVIIWVSLILMVVWRDGTRGLLRPKIAAMCLAPFVGQALLMHFEVAAAVQSQLARAPLSPETRAAMANQQLGHKMLTELAIMIGLFRSHAVRAISQHRLVFCADTHDAQCRARCAGPAWQGVAGSQRLRAACHPSGRLRPVAICGDYPVDGHAGYSFHHVLISSRHRAIAGVARTRMGLRIDCSNNAADAAGIRVFRSNDDYSQ